MPRFCCLCLIISVCSPVVNHPIYYMDSTAKYSVLELFFALIMDSSASRLWRSRFVVLTDPSLWSDSVVLAHGALRDGEVRVLMKKVEVFLSLVSDKETVHSIYIVYMTTR